MSIQRYSFTAQRRLEIHKEEEGDYVRFTDHAAEVKRLMAERDEMRNARDVLRQVAEKTEGLRREVEAERDAAVREREETGEALKEVLATPSFGALHAADAVATIKMVRAAIAKIEGERG